MVFCAEWKYLFCLFHVQLEALLVLLILYQVILEILYCIKKWLDILISIRIFQELFIGFQNQDIPLFLFLDIHLQFLQLSLKIRSILIMSFNILQQKIILLDHELFELVNRSEIVFYLKVLLLDLCIHFLIELLPRIDSCLCLFDALSRWMTKENKDNKLLYVMVDLWVINKFLLVFESLLSLLDDMDHAEIWWNIFKLMKLV